MLLEIKNGKSIEMLQQEFAVNFPFLKIEFFDEPHDLMEGSPDSHLLDASQLIGNIRTRHNEGQLEINPAHTVYYVEKLLRNRYGLYAQIYRRKSNGWVQTAGSDPVCLEEQNEIGRRAAESEYPRGREEFLESEY